jgi:hypothetical protein
VPDSKALRAAVRLAGKIKVKIKGGVRTLI